MLIKTSPGHFHRYWLTADDWSTDEHGCADFAAVMERMVESYSYDRNTKDIARVLRLPDFFIARARRRIWFSLKRAGAVIAGQKSQPRFTYRAGKERAKRRHRKWAAKIVTNSVSLMRSNISTLMTAIFGCNVEWLSRITSATPAVICGMTGRDGQTNITNTISAAWKSFKRNGISISTLFYHAQQAGWRDKRNWCLQRPPSEGFDGFEGSEGSHFSGSAASEKIARAETAAQWPLASRCV